jgi:hypothetical protein
MKKIVLLAAVMALATASYSQKGSDKGVFDNAVYARIGYAFPGGDLKSDELITAGAQFEVGTIFYINALTMPEKLKLGVDVTYASITGLVNRKTMKDNNETVSYFTAGMKVGPCVSYNFAPDFVADLYFKLHPHQFITGQKADDREADNQFRLGTSFGLNLRWKALMVGCEFTSAKYEFKRSVAAKAMTDSKSTVKLPITNLTLGVNF